MNLVIIRLVILIKPFRCSINSAKQAVVATFIALALVISGVVAIATPFTYDLVWNALFDVAMEQNEQQALKFEAFADSSMYQLQTLSSSSKVFFKVEVMIRVTMFV